MDGYQPVPLRSQQNEYPSSQLARPRSGRTHPASGPPPARSGPLDGTQLLSIKSVPCNEPGPARTHAPSPQDSGSQHGIPGSGRPVLSVCRTHCLSTLDGRGPLPNEQAAPRRPVLPDGWSAAPSAGGATKLRPCRPRRDRRLETRACKPIQRTGSAILRIGAPNHLESAAPSRQNK